jgi:hypothetical protein
MIDANLAVAPEAVAAGHRISSRRQSHLSKRRVTHTGVSVFITIEPTTTVTIAVNLEQGRPETGLRVIACDVSVGQ